MGTERTTGQRRALGVGGVRLPRRCGWRGPGLAGVFASRIRAAERCRSAVAERSELAARRLDESLPESDERDGESPRGRLDELLPLDELSRSEDREDELPPSPDSADATAAPPVATNRPTPNATTPALARARTRSEATRNPQSAASRLTLLGALYLRKRQLAMNSRWFLDEFADEPQPTLELPSRVPRLPGAWGRVPHIHCIATTTRLLRNRWCALPDTVVLVSAVVDVHRPRAGSTAGTTIAWLELRKPSLAYPGCQACQSGPPLTPRITP